jgi:uncharacterized membrane protein
MRDEREPISRGQLDRRAADRRALGNTIWFVAFLAVVVLVNGILAILGIEVLQAVGVWSTPEASPNAP